MKLNIVQGMPPLAKEGEMIALDIEMFGQVLAKLHRPHGTFACITICMEHDPKTVYMIRDTSDLKKLFKIINKGVWSFHNALYDLKQLRRWVDLQDRFIFDIMLLEQATSGGYYKNFSLKDMARRYLGIVMNKETRDNFEGATGMSPQMIQYSAEDANITLQIALIMKRELEGCAGYDAFITDQKMISPLLDINGTRVDVGAWTTAIKGFEETADKLQDEIGVNVNSSRQVLAFLAKNGVHLQNTQAKTLTEYKDVEAVQHVLEARMYRKAVSTYGMKWLENFVEEDGKVYPSWHITGAETGRMASSKPNGQNIPARKLPIFRTFFIPSDGHVMGVYDVSQQEPCILAYESKDPTLISAIVAKEDLHQAVANAIQMDRSIGKAINLGIGYGLSAYGLSTRVGVTEERAEQIITSYFTRFPGVFAWIQSQRNFARSQGYVTTSSTGRKVYLNTYDRQWQNNAINAPIQGGAADFTKTWVRKYWEHCRSMKIPYSLCMIVHDENVMDTPKELIRENNKAIRNSFEETSESLFPGIPFRYEGEHGKSWACKQLETEAWHEFDEIEEEAASI